MKKFSVSLLASFFVVTCLVFNPVQAASTEGSLCLGSWVYSRIPSDNGKPYPNDVVWGTLSQGTRVGLVDSSVKGWFGIARDQYVPAALVGWIGGTEAPYQLVNSTWVYTGRAVRGTTTLGALDKGISVGLVDAQMGWWGIAPNQWVPSSLVTGPNTCMTSSGPKKIVVDISEQRIYAFENNTIKFSALVSTGISQYPTPIGEFEVIRKIALDFMTGGDKALGTYYYLPNVPSILYFTGEGHAIHGTYWHNSFGRRMSHGCVNLDIPTAKKFFDWSEIGTPISIRP